MRRRAGGERDRDCHVVHYCILTRRRERHDNYRNYTTRKILDRMADSFAHLSRVESQDLVHILGMVPSEYLTPSLQNMVSRLQSALKQVRVFQRRIDYIRTH